MSFDRMDRDDEVQPDQIEDYCRQLGLQLRDEQVSVDDASQISVLGAAVVGENSNESGQPIPSGHAKLQDKDKTNFQCKKCDKNFANSRQFLKHRCILKSDEKQPKPKKRGRKPRVPKSATEGASDEVNTEVNTSKDESELLADGQVGHLSDHTYIKDDGETVGQTTPDKSIQCDSCQLLAELDPDSVNNPDKIPCEKCQELVVAATPILGSTDEPTSKEESTNKKRKYSFKTKEQDCPHCYKGFHSQKRFDKHLLVCKSNLTCSFCNKDFSGIGRMAYTAHYYTHLETMPFTCSVCSRGFIRKADLDRHKIIHTDDYSPQRCTQCGAVFASAENLAKHMHKHERLPLSCEKCGQQFARQATLDKHIVACQTETSCEVCGKVFKCLSKNLKSRYQEHMFIHTGEKPYKCQFCERGFRDRSTRRKHERTHTGEKPYPCTVCQRAFSQLRLLRNHVRTHTGEKPYACHICPLSFAKSCNLKYHMRVHTKEKPYHCEICNKCFTQSGTYHKHMRRHASTQTSLPASMIQTIAPQEGELVPEAENAMIHDTNPETIPDDTFAPETISIVVDKEDGTPDGNHDIDSNGQDIPTEESPQLQTDSTATIPEMPAYTISGEEITIIVSEGDGASATLTTTIDVDQISSMLASCS